MNMKKGLVCLLIVAMLMFCLPNVASASASRQTTNVHRSFAMDVPVKEQPVLVLLFSSNVTTVNTSVDLYGALATGTKSKINYIEGATVNIQRMSYNGTWYTEGTLTTMSGKFSGCFIAHITPKDPGTYIYRATYDGDNTYASAVSNVVQLIAN